MNRTSGMSADPAHAQSADEPHAVLASFALPLVLALLLGLAQTAWARDPGVIRFGDGLQFSVPPGWTWQEYTGGFVRLLHEGTTVKGERRLTSRNEIEILVKEKAEFKFDDPAWTQLTRNEALPLPNGRIAYLKIGTKYSIHHHFYAEVHVQLGGPRLQFNTNLSYSNFDSALIESTMVEIVKSLRPVAVADRLYHPRLSYSVAQPDRKRWYVAVSESGISFYCFASVCGQGSRVAIHAYPSSRPFPSADATHAEIAQWYASNQGVTARGPGFGTRFVDGELKWTEQSGTTAPFLGGILRGGRPFFASVTASNSVSPGNDHLRGDFLKVAESIQPWDSTVSSSVAPIASRGSTYTGPAAAEDPAPIDFGSGPPQVSAAGDAEPRTTNQSGQGLLPATISYLVELGIDPNSPEVRTAAIDKINGEDLNTLAADRARRDVPRFIATRNFIRALRLNPRTEFPRLYEAAYLTQEEKAFVGGVVAKRLQGLGGR
jgi:hypothetical protein